MQVFFQLLTEFAKVNKYYLKELRNYIAYFSQGF